MGLDHSEGRVSPSWFLCSGILWDSFSRQFVDMMGVNGLCLLLTADSVFPRGFGVLSFGLCLELQQLSLLGERSAASLDWSWEWSRAALLSVPQHSLSFCSYPAPPEWSRPSQVLLWAMVLIFVLPKLFLSYLTASSFSSLLPPLAA